MYCCELLDIIAITLAKYVYATSKMGFDLSGRTHSGSGCVVAIVVALSTDVWTGNYTVEQNGVRMNAPWSCLTDFNYLFLWTTAAEETRGIEFIRAHAKITNSKTTLII